MLKIASSKSIRQAESEYFAQYPDADLMGIAAGEVARVATEMLTESPNEDTPLKRANVQGAQVLMVVGPGNNGGDGLFAAVALAEQGVQVQAWQVTNQIHESGRDAAIQAGVTFVPANVAVELLSEVDLVIDALYGIGGHPGLPKQAADFAAACKDLSVPVLSVDIPSGLSADSSRLETSFEATRTVTFIALKRCHVMEPAKSRCGEVELVDIGVPVPDSRISLVELADLARRWPWPTAASDKYSRGVAGISAGSAKYPGAGILAAYGAVYSGAGMVRFAGAEQSARELRSLLPNVVFGQGRANSWVAGSGWGVEDPVTVDSILALGVPTVLDAEALNYRPSRPLTSCLMTPHAGELAAGIGVERAWVEANPIPAVREASSRTSATVLLKGATQYCAAPSGQVLIAIPGPHWTAQAGSGDVLAGICGTLLAAGLEPIWAGALAASVQALAASKRPGPWPPHEVAKVIPEVLADLQGKLS